ncbi:MAG: LysR family transcriptional regulator [Lachnospiraceae bacterium]
MNTIYLKYAVEVEEAGSITQAAQNLYMAQPNLSKAVKDLESELGYAIFKRTSGGISVTEKGGEFLYHARKMLDQLGEMEKISSRENGAGCRFKVSIPRGSYIADGFAAFVAELPMTGGMEITINETNALKTIDNVVNRGYNMGIIRYQKKDEDFFEMCLKNNRLAHEMIWEFEYVLVMSQDHSLAKKKIITREDLSGFVKITHGDIEIPHANVMENSMRASRDTQSKTIYVYERGSQFDLLANVPSTYMWVSPIPDSYLKKNCLVQRACKTENNLYKDVLIYRRDYELGKDDKLFQKKLYESKVEVASERYQ